MLIDGALYSLPDGMVVHAVRMEGNWIRLDMLDGTPYVGIFSFGVQRIICDSGGAVYTVPCDLCEEDFVLVKPGVHT